MTAADITWDSYAWPTAWLPAMTALDGPAPDAAAESVPIYDAALAAHRAAGGSCPTCGGADRCREGGRFVKSHGVMA